jgi:hypothetical protein
MVRGTMTIPIREKGKPKIVEIKEGHFFILPSRIPHSPQVCVTQLYIHFYFFFQFQINLRLFSIQF